MNNGIALTLASALLFGSITAFSSLLLNELGPATLGALTYFGAGLVGLLMATCEKAPSRVAADPKQGLAFLIALLLGAIVAPLLLMDGLQNTAAQFASVLTNIEGIAAAGLAWLFFKERSDATGIVGVVVILAGITAFTLANDIDVAAGRGSLLVAIAYLCWAVDVNLMKRVSGITPARATAIRGMAGALVMGGVACWRNETLPAVNLWMASVITGALGFGVSFMLMLKALRLIGTPKTSAIFASAPVFGYVVSSLTETGRLSASVFQWTSIAIIAMGVSISGAGAFFVSRVADSRPAKNGMSFKETR